MQSKDFINHIRNPHKIQASHLPELNQLCSDHPYCSSLHKLQLKALKESKSNKYNKQLRYTAAISGNRELLFQFITQPYFKAPIEESLTKLDQSPKEKIQLGSPIEFDLEETHSFNEWLKITKIKPINRSINIKENKINPIEKTNKIVNFINENKHRKKPKKEFLSSNQNNETIPISENHLMTETLAKIYLEQGHYDKAITAYEILSLKYPQKSSLFANQIKAIKQINS